MTQIRYAVKALKGGVGKSTLVPNLAAAAQLRGIETAVVCYDAQGTVLSHAKAGNYPFDVTDDIRDVTDDYQLVLIDYAGGLEELPVEENVLVVTHPCLNEIDSDLLQREKLKGSGKHVVTVANMCHMRMKDDQEYVGQLRELYDAHIIGFMQPFRKANNRRTTVFDKQITGSGQARGAIQLLLKKLGVTHGDD